MPTLQLGDVELNYIDEGEGAPLLLVHNLTSNINGFKYNIGDLSQHYRVIAADLRGHGRTTHQDDFDEAPSFYRFDAMVDDHLALLDHLGIDRFYVFGQAYWGANTALHLFERASDRVRGLVLSSAYMIVSEPGHKAYDVLGEEGRANFLRMHQLAREEGMMAVYRDRIAFGQFWGPRVLNDETILDVFAEAHATTSAAAFVAIPELTTQRRQRIAAALAERKPPLMLLIGEDELERNRRLFMQEMRRDYPATHVMIVPDAGHYPTIENPADFNQALLNFYAGVAAAPRPRTSK